MLHVNENYSKIKPTYLFAEIAHRVGFGTTHNFSRFFSEQAGESATDFRTRTVAERKEAFKGK